VDYNWHSQQDEQTSQKNVIRGSFLFLFILLSMRILHVGHSPSLGAIFFSILDYTGNSGLYSKFQQKFDLQQKFDPRDGQRPTCEIWGSCPDAIAPQLIEDKCVLLNDVRHAIFRCDMTQS